MEINLTELEAFTLYLHLKEWLEEFENYRNSDNFELCGKWTTLKNIYDKLKSKI